MGQTTEQALSKIKEILTSALRDAESMKSNLQSTQYPSSINKQQSQKKEDEGDNQID